MNQEQTPEDRLAFAFAPVAFLTLDARGCVCLPPAGDAGVLAEPGQDVLGRPLEDLVVPEDGPTLRAFLKLVSTSSTRHGCDVELRRQGGAPRNVRLEALRSADAATCHVVVLDITHPRRHVSSIRETEARLVHAMQLANLGSWEVDLRSQQVWASQETRALAGLPGDVNSLRQALDLVVPLDRPRLELAAADALKSNRVPTLEFRLRRPSDGEERWLRLAASVLRDDDGAPFKVVGMLQDVTDLKEADGALQESAQRYERIASTAPVVLFDCVLDADGSLRFLHVSNTCRDLLEVEPAAVMEDPGCLARLMPTEDRERLARENLAASRAQADLATDLRLTTPSGKARWVHVSARPNPAAPGERPVWSGFLTDITARKHAEHHQLMLGKLESTGVLAGGIAHDFNNLLTTLVVNLELALTWSASRSEMEEYLQDAKQAALSARSLTQQFISFAKGSTTVRRPVDVGQLVRAEVAQGLEGSGVRAEVDLPPSLWRTSLDQAQMAKVFGNLLANAREAMPQGGVVGITAANVDLVAGHASNLPPGPYVCVTITDHGEGIAPEALTRIFDPYFSTKERGAQRGMGLGLTLCHSVVHRHGGNITVESTLGVGSTFRVFLPAEPETLPPQPAGPARAVAAGTRVLIMDDEAHLRDLAGRALSTMGFSVDLAEDGEAALALFTRARDEGRPFSAVLLDLSVRGGMGGQETLAALKLLDPGVKAVVMSGYIHDEAVLDPQGHGFRQALGKPFTVQALRTVVAEVVAGP